MNPMCEQVFPVFMQFREELERYIRRKVGNAAVAEDLAGGLVLRLYDHCEKLDKVENVRAWLYRLAHNTAMDYHRQQNHERQAEANYDQEPTDMAEAKLMESAEHCAVCLLDELPDTYRIPIRLADLEGVSQKEIAVRLSLNYSAVKMRVQRGREKLRALLVACLEEERSLSDCSDSDRCSGC